MSTAWDEKGAEVDAENKLFWRMDRRRLEAEEIRDAIIAVGEGLDLTMGGSMLTFKHREYVTSIKSRDTTDYDARRLMQFNRDQKSFLICHRQPAFKQCNRSECLKHFCWPCPNY